MTFYCNWCDGKRDYGGIRGQVSGASMPILCEECGTKIGFITHEELNEILKELRFYKNKALTNQK